MLPNKRRRSPLWFAPLAVLLVAGTVLMLTTPSSAKPSLVLDYLTSEEIGLSAKGLDEPSGLALSSATGEFWIISDDTSTVFKISPGNLKNIHTMPVSEGEMEAITLAEKAGYFFTVNESKGRIARFSMSDGKQLERQRIHGMAGYTDISERIKSAKSNSGFEGLAWHSERATLFAVFEGPPGILVEISADLKTIVSSTELTTELGFTDPKNNIIDFSGLSYDTTRKRLWILSDEAARVFLFDLDTKRVTENLPLHRISAKGKRKKIKKAEGIAVSLDGNTLYVVSDSKATLYQWNIRSLNGDKAADK